MPHTGTDAPKAGPRSLVIAPQWLGDAVMTEPLLRQLGARGERLTVACLPMLEAVYRSMPQVSDVLVLPFAHGRLDWAARRALGRELRGRFDRAYVLPNSLKSALLPWMAGIARRIGYVGEMRVGLLNDRLPNPSKHQRGAMVDHYAALSRNPSAVALKPRLRCPDDGVGRALQALGLPAGPFAVLAPGSEYGSAKRWPAERFHALGRKWLAAVGGQVLVLGSAKEVPIAQAVVNEHAQFVNLAGRTSVAQAIALISAAQFVASNDSGLMHVAAAFRIPQVAVFGSSSPEHTPPLSDRAAVVWLKTDPTYEPALDCAPCFARECRFGHTRCLRDVSADRAWAAAAHLHLPVAAS